MTCTASGTESSYYECQNAYDGISNVYDNCGCEWYGDDSDPSWIKIDLPGSAVIYKARLWFSCDDRGQTDNLQFEFSDTTLQPVSSYG